MSGDKAVGKMHLDYLQQSKAIEWKVNLFIWGSIGLAMNFFVANKNARPHFVAAVIFCFIFIVLHWHWLRKIQASQDMHKAQWLAQTSESEDKATIRRCCCCGCLCTCSCCSQFISWEGLAIAVTTTLFTLLLAVTYDLKEIFSQMDAA